jgi:hypothetical protein
MLVLMSLLLGCPHSSATPDATHVVPENTFMSFTGVAANGKRGAVVLVGADVFYLDGIDAWPDEAVGKQVAVSGTLVYEKLGPDPVIADNGDRTQGMEGEASVITNPSWSIVP